MSWWQPVRMGRFLNRQGREVRQGGIGFLNSSLFLPGELGGENSPYGEGSCCPFAEDLEIGSLGLCKGAGSTLLHIVGFSLPSLIALPVRSTRSQTSSHPFAALMRSFPPHHRANTRCVGHFIKMTLPQNTNSSQRSLCDLCACGENLCLG